MGKGATTGRPAKVTRRATVNNGYGADVAKAKAAQRTMTTATQRRGNLGPRELSNAYQSSAIVRQVVDYPALGALSKWRTWGGDETQNKLIEAAERALGIKGKLIEAYSRSRKDGGCAVLIGTQEEDYSKPLDLRKLAKGGIEFVTVLPRHLFTRIDINAQPGTVGYREATMFYLSLTVGRGVNQQRTIDKIHPSRLVIFRGEKRFSHQNEISLDAYWGDSVLQSLMPGINELESTYTNTAFMTYEARTPVLTLGEVLSNSTQSEKAKLDTMEMLNNFNDFKGITGMSVLNAGMTYTIHNYNFAGLPPIIAQFETRVAAEANIPATILFARAPQGLNATGQSDITIWHERLSADQSLIIQPAIQFLDDALVRHALGTITGELTYDWNDLAETNDLQRAQVFNIEAERIAKLIEAGLLDAVPGKEIIDKMLANSGLGVA